MFHGIFAVIGRHDEQSVLKFLRYVLEHLTQKFCFGIALFQAKTRGDRLYLFPYVTIVWKILKSTRRFIESLKRTGKSTIDR